MKPIIISMIAMSVIFGISSCGQGKAGEQGNNVLTAAIKANPGDRVEVYYFHFERRCISCILVQQATEKVLAENHAEEIENGSLVYYEINLSNPESLETARLLGVGGQALLVVSGNKKYDLTMQGFMLAARDYNRFKETLELAIARVKT